MRPARTSLSVVEHEPRYNPYQENPMKYMLMIFGNEAAQQAMTKEQTAQRMAAYTAYADALRKAGVMAGGARAARARRPMRLTSARSGSSRTRR